MKSVICFLLCFLMFSVSAYAKKYTVGFSQSNTAESDWRKANTASFQEAAKEQGVNLLFLDAGGKTDVQKEQLKQLIDAKVSAIVFSANEATGWDEVLLQAKKAKIPVILSDRTIELKSENKEKGLYTAWVGSDFRYEGRVAAAWLAAEVAGKANIVEIEGPPESSPAIERSLGFKEVIKLFPQMKIIKSKTGMWGTDQGKLVMKSFLETEGRNIDVVFAHNDNMAIGAVQAIEEDKRYHFKPGKDIIVIGIDAVKEGFQLLAQGKINALIECNPVLGPIVLKVVGQVLSGNPVPKKMYSTERVYTVHTAKNEISKRKY